MKKTTVYAFLCLLSLIIAASGAWSLTISGNVQELGSDDTPIVGAAIEAWNAGGWMDDECVSGADGAFLLDDIGSGPGYQIFVGRDATYVDICTQFIVINADRSGLLLDLIPLNLWNATLSEYDPTNGYILGEVLTNRVEDSFIEGAVVKLFDKNDTAIPDGSFTIIYFDQDYNLAPALTTTSASGLFLVIIPADALDESNTDPMSTYPHAKYKDIKVTAQKDGWTFQPLNVTRSARVFPYDDPVRVGAGIVTTAAVLGTQNPIIPEEPKDEEDNADDGGGGGGGCFINTAALGRNL